MPLKVNGEVVPLAAIEHELNRLVSFYSRHMSAAQLRTQMDLLKQKAKDQAVGAKLLLNEARRLDLTVTNEEIDERLGQLIEESGGPEKFRSICARQNISEAMVRQGILEGRRTDLLVKKITEGVQDPSELEMKRHFDEHSGEYSREPRAQIQHILIAVSSSDAGKRDEARTRLLDIRKRAEAGEDFAQLAAACSDCPSGRKTGGSLGWISRGAVVPEIENAVFALKDGEISGVVETRLGFHIFKKNAYDDSGEASYDDAREKIREFLRHARRGEAIAAYVAELKQKVTVEET